MPDSGPTLWTIGTGHRSLEELLALLRQASIEVLADVRSYPKSHLPHFSRPELERSLREAGIEYVWMGDDLGGLRAGGYRQHMGSDRFERGRSRLQGHFMFHHDAFFTRTEGWDPPPMPRPDGDEWPMQHNLRFSPARLFGAGNLAVVLVPAHAELAPAAVTTERAGEAELARIGEDVVLVNQGAGIEHEDLCCEALAAVRLGGRAYEVRETGIIS